MSYKRSKQILITISVVLCLAVSMTGLYAGASLEGRGQLTVKILYGNEAVSGMYVNLHRIAAVKHEAEERVFEPLMPEFASAAPNWDGTLDELTANQVNELAMLFAAHAVNSGIPAQASGVTGENGTVAFTRLDTGLYLVTQGNKTTASHFFAPAIVAIVNEGEAIELRTKTEAPPTPTQPPSTPPPTTSPPPDILPTGPPDDDIDPPYIPGDNFPYDDIDDPRIPLDPFPDGDLPQTGITNRNTIIAILISLGITLIICGMLYQKRIRRMTAEN